MTIRYCVGAEVCTHISFKDQISFFEKKNDFPMNLDFYRYIFLGGGYMYHPLIRSHMFCVGKSLSVILMGRRFINKFPLLASCCYLCWKLKWWFPSGTVLFSTASSVSHQKKEKKKTNKQTRKDIQGFGLCTLWTSPQGEIKISKC